ncbi:MAG: protoporphyrinogen oxidase [Rhodospirillaceae bacterium]|nr:protoporphyrinogen oxidase [Rhodospirillaceae bacterium]
MMLRAVWQMLSRQETGSMHEASAMNILILYGTTEGQTRKIAQFMHDRLDDADHRVTLIDAAAAHGSLDPRAFDVVFIAASLHMERYQPAVTGFVHRHANGLSHVKAAFVSVSLAAAGHDEEDKTGLQKCVAEFARTTGWTPKTVLHVAGAFRFAQYDFFKS